MRAAWAMGVALALASCGGPLEPGETDEAEQLFYNLVPTQTVAKRQFLNGYDPYFDRLAGTMFKTDCAKISLTSPASSARISWINTSEQLKDSLKASGLFALNTSGFDGSAEGQLTNTIEKYTEDLYFLMNFEQSFNLEVDLLNSNVSFTPKAQKIIDDVNSGALSAHDGAVAWLAAGGPGYVAIEERGASLVVLIRVHSENAHTNLDLAGKLDAKLNAAGVTVGELNATIGDQLMQQLNNMQVSVVVRARGFTLPANDQATDKLLWGLITPASNNAKPFTAVIDAALAQQPRLVSSVAASQCIVSNELNKTTNECKDGDTVVKNDISSVLRFSAEKYTRFPDCLATKKLQAMFDELYQIWSESMAYAEAYRLITTDGIRANFEMNDAISTPTRHSFLNSDAVKPPYDRAGIQKRFDRSKVDYLKNLDPAKDGALARALKKRDACVQAVGGGIYEPKCTPAKGAQSEQEYKDLKSVITFYKQNDRVPLFYYTVKPAIAGKDLAAFVATCSEQGRQLPLGSWSQYLSLAQASFPRPLTFWISNQGQNCPDGTNAVASMSLFEGPPNEEVTVTFDCYSTAAPPPATKSTAGAVCVAKNGIFGLTSMTDGVFGLSSIWRRPNN